ncbi:MAG TPA: citrate synthase [Terriglobales bacterium]|nr:citrate synthase [Terriglobales bacterium]
MGSTPIVGRGLEGVTAANSSICYIDGDNGVLAYRGYDIHDLADQATFEEVCFLLWRGWLPTRAELQDLRICLWRESKLDASIISLLRQAPRHALPMDVLRTVVSALSFYDPEAGVPATNLEADMRKSIRLTAQLAMVVAYFDRIRKGLPLVEPDRTLSHAGNFLWMLTGKPPSREAERALDVALILHADHELNASTFAARVTAATLSDVHSAITSAIGALKGPLHGGANEEVFRILEAIDASGADATDYVQGMLAQKQKIPGFGHRVYRTEDPRATHLREMSRELSAASGEPKWFVISKKIEDFIKAEKRLNANVDFYSASTYHTLGIDLDLFTPIFAVSRVSGWTAHVLEQLADNRLIRPRAEYIGPAYRQTYVPIERRQVAA